MRGDKTADIRFKGVSADGNNKINVPAVLNAGSQAKKAKEKQLRLQNQNIRSIKNRIDPKVINKGDLSAKFRNIDSQLKSVSQKLTG